MRTTDLRGNSRDRAKRKQWLLTTFGDGETVQCVFCPCVLTAETVTADRIVPGKHGGRYVRSNLQPACGRCNSSRGDKPIEDFVAGIEISL